MDTRRNNPLTFGFGLKKKPTFRNSRNNNVQDVSDTNHKQAEEGVVPKSDLLNSFLANNLLDKGDDAAILLSDKSETNRVLPATSDEIKGISECLLSLPLRSPTTCLKNKLLVLDLNGLLVDIVFCPPKHYKASMRVRRKSVFIRPFCHDFLKFCFERFEVGIWSSRTKENINDIIDNVLGDMKQRFLFCWDISHCSLTQFNTLENKHKPLVFKDLKRIWEKHDPELPWEKGYFNESNTLLLDDSPYKALLNPVNTAIFPHSYRFQDRQDNALGVGGDLRLYLERLAEADNIQQFVEKHPFGQKAINEKSSSWCFYLEVLNTLHHLPITR